MSDREKVLKGLECCSESIGKACPMECPYRTECLMQDDGSQMYSVMHAALKLLKKQSKQRFFVDSDGKMTPLPIQPQWISVKERMPDKQPDEYLVVNGHIVETAICLDNMWITPKRVSKITHWMPLPEPPEEVMPDE